MTRATWAEDLIFFPVANQIMPIQILHKLDIPSFLEKHQLVLFDGYDIVKDIFC